MARRVRVFFINCPTLDVEAASLLILAQNGVQNAIQFEIHHFWIYGRSADGQLTGLVNKCLFSENREDNFHGGSRWREKRYRRLLDLRSAEFFKKEIPVDEKEWQPAVSSIMKRYDDWLTNLDNHQHDIHSEDPVIVITETPLFGKYVSLSTTNLAILSAAHWKSFVGSTSLSALEYLLAGIQRLSLRLCFGGVIGSHWPTRGCVWDFDVHQPDVKMHISLGNLCEVCRQGLKKQASPDEFLEITVLIKNDMVKFFRTRVSRCFSQMLILKTSFKLLGA